MLGISKAPSAGLRELYDGLHRPWYCGTCKALHRYYGLWSRGILHFDIVLLGELIAAIADVELPRRYNNGLCMDIPAHREFLPLHRYLADLHAAFLYVRRRDALRDGEHRLAVALSGLAAQAMHRALDNLECQGIPRVVWDHYLRDQWRLEGERHCVLNYARPTEQFCAVLLRVGAEVAGCADRAEALVRFGRALGRWMYLVDALRDLKDDLRQGRFNAFSHSIEGIRTVEEALPYVQSAQDALVSTIKELGLSAEREGYFIDRLDYVGRYGAKAQHACSHEPLHPQSRLHTRRRAWTLAAAASAVLLVFAGWHIYAGLPPWVATTTGSSEAWSSLLRTALQWLWLPWALVAGSIFWKRRAVLRRWWHEWKAGWQGLWKGASEEHKKHRPWWKVLLKVLLYLLLTVVGIVLLLICCLVILIANSDSDDCTCRCQSSPQCNCGDGGSGCNCNTGGGGCNCGNSGGSCCN